MFNSVIRLKKSEEDLLQISNAYESVRDDNVLLREEFYSICDFDVVRKVAFDLGMIPMEDVERVYIKMDQPKEEQTLNIFQKAINHCIEMFGGEPKFAVEK